MQESLSVIQATLLDRNIDQRISSIIGFGLVRPLRGNVFGNALDLGDFDLVFAFPWPNDEPFMKEIFGRFSGDGALYLTYGDAEDVYLYRNEQ